MSRKRPGSMMSPTEPSVWPIRGVARLRWLVEFAQQASGPMDPGAERRLVRTLGFCLRDVTLRGEGNGPVVDLCEPKPTPASVDLPLGREDNQKSVPEKLALIRVAVQTLLSQYLSGGAGQSELEAVVTLRRRLGAFVRDQPEANDLRDALAYVLLEELTTFGERLLRCAASGCGRLFVRERRQRYCSVSCRNRTSFQRWYRRHRKAGPRPKKHDAAKKPRAPRAARGT